MSTKLIENNKKHNRVYQSKYIALTYNKLPFDYHVHYNIMQLVVDINTQFSNKELGKPIRSQLHRLYLQKEYYNVEKNPDNNGLCHLHGLAILDKRLKVINKEHIARRFILRYLGVEYYPYIDIVYNQKAYKEYIQKTHNDKEEYGEEEYYSEYIDNREEEIEENIEELYRKWETLSDSQVANIVTSIPKMYREKHWKDIQRLQQRVLHLKQLKSENIQINNFLANGSVEYKLSDFKNHILAPISEKIFQRIEKYMLTNSKHSMWISGPGNIGKTAFVKASIEQVLSKLPNKTEAYEIRGSFEQYTLELQKHLLNNREILAVLLFDDVRMSYGGKGKEAFEKEQYKEIMQGNSSQSIVPKRGMDGIVPKNTKKIYIQNLSIREILKSLTEENKELGDEYISRIEELVIYKDSSGELCLHINFLK